MTSPRYLLLLGSNLPGPERLQQAVTALAQLGTTALLTPVTRTPARHDPTRFYYNALLQLDCSFDRDTLVARLKQLEADLGRVRDGSGVVAIDIDLLATFADGVWMADPHAVAKREFDQSPARELLADAHVNITVVNA